MVYAQNLFLYVVSEPRFGADKCHYLRMQHHHSTVKDLEEKNELFIANNPLAKVDAYNSVAGGGDMGID